MEEQDRVFQSTEFNPARRRRNEIVKAFFVPLLEARVQSLTPLKKSQPREEDRYVWGSGLRSFPHIYPPTPRDFFSALIFNKEKRGFKDRGIDLIKGRW
jgi:hypothetical protein